MPTFRNTVPSSPPMKMEQNVPKRRHIKFRRREITQKKRYSIQNTAKVWNQEPEVSLSHARAGAYQLISQPSTFMERSRF